jgi:AcrR family transcriptional regulator
MTLMNTSTGPGRANQKQRTRMAIVAAARDLSRAGGELTMPAVARAALISEATAYRYFPDLVSLLQEAFIGSWPSPAESLAPVADCADPVVRVACAAEVLLRGVHTFQSAVRAMISASITRPEVAAARPGQRFLLIDQALAPPADLSSISAGRLAQLRRDLAVAVIAEALFTLTDLCGLPAEEAIASGVQTARTLAEAAFRAAGRLASGPARPDLTPPGR